MMQKIQRFGGAMFTPALLFAFSGIVVGFCTLFQNEVIMGSIAQSTTSWYQFWYVIREAAQTVFRQVPLLFVISLPIGLAKKQNARASMESFVLYITFNYALAAMLTLWGSNFGVDFAQNAGSGTGLVLVASIKTLDTGMVGALAIAGIVVFLHNKFFDTELPEWLGVFKGSSFICMIGFPIMIALAFIFMVIWPPIQGLISNMQTFFLNSGAMGIGIYTFCERLLIPTGLHHFIYMPFFYDNIAINGGVRAAWVELLPTIKDNSVALTTLFPSGGFTMIGMSKIFAPIGISAAFYFTAKPERKKAVIGLMVPVTLTAMFAGITEPIEFTFLFIAPILFVVHSFLAAVLTTVMYMFGITGSFSSGIIQTLALNWLPLGPLYWRTYLLQFVIGFIFSGIWFVVFKLLIEKMNLPTPGREEDDEQTRLITKAEYKASKANDGNSNAIKAAKFLEALGGKDNIEDVTNCATRLRVTVKDPELVQSLNVFKKAGAHGLVNNKKAIQVIVGLSVSHVRDEFEKLL